MSTSKSARYEVFILRSAQKDLDGLKASVLERFVKKIRALSRDARPPGCLKLTGEGGYRLRIGDYRLLYRIDDAAKRVYICRLKHRKEVYP